MISFDWHIRLPFIFDNLFFLFIFLLFSRPFLFSMYSSFLFFDFMIHRFGHRNVCLTCNNNRVYYSIVLLTIYLYLFCWIVFYWNELFYYFIILFSLVIGCIILFWCLVFIGRLFILWLCFWLIIWCILIL